MRPSPILTVVLDNLLLFFYQRHKVHGTQYQNYASHNYLLNKSNPVFFLNGTSINERPEVLSIS
jgi:hypothetical protein